MVYFDICGNTNKHSNGKASLAETFFQKLLGERRAVKSTHFEVENRVSCEINGFSVFSGPPQKRPFSGPFFDPPKRCPYRPLYTGSRFEMPTGGPGLFFGGPQNPDFLTPQKSIFRVCFFFSNSFGSQRPKCPLRIAQMSILGKHVFFSGKPKILLGDADF